MDLGEELVIREYSFNLLGLAVPLTETVIVTWIVMAFLIVMAVIFTRKLEFVPSGKQNIIESVVEGINSFTKNTIGHEWKCFAPYIGTIMLFLIVSNIISIFNVFPNWEQVKELTHIEAFEHLPEFFLRPPTKDINVTVCMAFMTMIMVIGAEIRFKRFSGWVKSFANPLKLLEYFIRPLSLSLRLFGNIVGAFIVMELIYIAFPPILPAAFSIYFDLFDGILQAYVFVFLTTLYIAEAIE